MAVQEGGEREGTFQKKKTITKGKGLKSRAARLSEKRNGKQAACPELRSRNTLKSPARASRFETTRGRVHSKRNEEGSPKTVWEEKSRCPILET